MKIQIFNTSSIFFGKIGDARLSQFWATARFLNTFEMSKWYFSMGKKFLAEIFKLLKLGLSLVTGLAQIADTELLYNPLYIFEFYHLFHHFAKKSSFCFNVF